MAIKDLVGSFFAFFALVFVVNAGVTYLYGLIAHGQGGADWLSSVRTGIIVGFVLTWIVVRQKKKLED